MHDSHILNDIVNPSLSFESFDSTFLEATSELLNSGLIDALHDYSPKWVGTIPLGICITDSDIDILCESSDLSLFETTFKNWRGDENIYSICQYKCDDLPSSVINFYIDKFQVEIFCQARPVENQVAFLHYQIEKRLLDLGGESFRSQIMAIRKKGIKTEPAIAQALKLKGDPYQELLNLSSVNNQFLINLIESTL